jgi:hypothetical protein
VKIASQVPALDSEDVVVSVLGVALAEVSVVVVDLELVEALVGVSEVVVAAATLVEVIKELQVGVAMREVRQPSLLFPTLSLITQLLEPKEAKQSMFAM